MIRDTEEVWRLAEYVEGDGATLLAGNLSLLESVGSGEVQPTVRWYRYTHPCVVLGYGQNVSSVDRDACMERGVAVLRRPAGGSAVLADRGLLGLAIALRLPHPLASPDLTESYRWLGETLAAALSRLGVASRLVSIDEARADAAQVRAALTAADSVRGLACFGSFSPYEVAVGRRKVVGLAQVRRRQAVLYQVGILLRSATELLAEVLSCPPAERALLSQALAERTTDLWSLLGREVEPDEVIARVHAELARRWGVALRPAPLTASELAATAAAVPRVTYQAGFSQAGQTAASSR